MCNSIKGVYRIRLNKYLGVYWLTAIDDEDDDDDMG